MDIRGGRCVRLVRGEAAKEIVYGEDPLEMASKWQELGAELLHVVDLDGAFAGKPINLDIVGRMVKSLTIPVELGGGLRDQGSLERALAKGVWRAVVGTSAALSNSFLEEACRRFPGKVAASIDARDGLVAIKGWTQTTQMKAIEVAKWFDGCGPAAIISTDILRDGALDGPNLAATEEMARAISTPLIASGGVAKLKDIEELRKLEPLGLCGVIVGRALYTGDLDFRMGKLAASGGGGGQDVV